MNTAAVCLYWTNGSYVNSESSEFEGTIMELLAQFGAPSHIRVLDTRYVLDEESVDREWPDCLFAALTLMWAPGAYANVTDDWRDFDDTVRTESAEFGAPSQVRVHRTLFTLTEEDAHA